MSTNLDTLRKGLGRTAMALVLVATGATQASAQHSRGDARPPSSSGSRSGSSSGGHSSPGHTSPSRPGGSGGRTQIPNDSRHHPYPGGGYGHYGGYGHGYHGGYYGGYWPYGWYGYWGSPWYWGWGGYGYPYYYPAATVYPNGSYGEMGALDLDLAPERAEVYVDGQRVGVADDFDGFPTYLWLQEGTYDVVFYLPGFQTLARQYTIYPGLIIDVDDTLQQGEAVRPEDLPSKSHERRDARLRDEHERQQEVERWERQQQYAPAPGGEEWREHAPSPAPEAVIPPGNDSRDARSQPGTLKVQIEPSDASVYLDGRFLGTAEELSHLRSGLIVDAGSHRLEVVRPGWKSATRSFEATAGGEVELGIALDRE